MNINKEPALVIEYTDRLEGFKGWLVVDTLNHKLCAGGMRVQQGLSRDHLRDMARNMTLKMQIGGLRVDGAKCGIDYDPLAPGKKAAVGRFLQAIKPYIRQYYSMGPDLNMDMAELEVICQGLGIPSPKMAIAHAQGWNLDYFLQRYEILHEKGNGYSVGRLRAGSGVAEAALSTLRFIGIPYNQASVAIQGFGLLGRAAAYFLQKAGVNIVAVSDVHKSLVSETGQALDITRLLQSKGPLLPNLEYEKDVRVSAPTNIFTIPCDVLIPVAVENTITKEIASDLAVRAVVPGANLAVTAEAETLLNERGVVVLPDFVVGCGGSLSMEGLFGPVDHPEPSAVLDYVKHKMATLVTDILGRAKRENITPTTAALRYCSEVVVTDRQKPYGKIENATVLSRLRASAA
jgi:glutamate dehydrogenase (NAD(P)+)